MFFNKRRKLAKEDKYIIYIYIFKFILFFVNFVFFLKNFSFICFCILFYIYIYYKILAEKNTDT